MPFNLGLGLGIQRGGYLFSPASLFAASEPGVIYDASDINTLFQDTAGTQPVTAAGQAVALVLDKSGSGNHATQSILASRPLYQVDASGRGYLLFDGVDDFLVTPTITPNTDKVQVFAGVRKLSDAAVAILVELGTNAAAVNGSFALFAPSASVIPAYRFSSRGTTTVNQASASTFLAPTTNVVTGVGDISGDVTRIRVNGSNELTTTTDQGTGNYSNAILYIGRRGGTTLPLNGRLYGLVVRFGPNLDAATIAATESWMNTKTGAY